MSQIVTFSELQALTGFTRVSDIERCLRKNGIRFQYGRNGIIYTTLTAINLSMGIEPNKTQEIDEPFDIL